MRVGEIDEIAKKSTRETGGKYFRATDNKKLEEIYEEIDLETEIEEFKITITKKSLDL